MPDVNAANELLKQKYENSVKRMDSRNVGSSTTDLYNVNKQFKGINIEAENPWKIIAEERKSALIEKTQLLIQFRDDAQSWQEAFIKERDRADKLWEQLQSLYLQMTNAPSEGSIGMEGSEIKEEIHKIQSPAQVNKRKSNWPAYKAAMEKRHSTNLAIEELVKAVETAPSYLQPEEIKE